MDPLDPRPTRHELAQIAREVLPRPPPDVGERAQELLVHAIVRAVALGVAAVALPGVAFLGDGSPPPGDVLLAATIVGLVGALWWPAWRHLAGPLRSAPFGATVLVLDLALLRVLDVGLGERFTTDASWELLTAAALVAVPTTVAAVVTDVLRDPDRFALPD